MVNFPIKTLVFGYQTNQVSGLLGNISRRRPTAISVYTGRIPARFYRAPYNFFHKDLSLWLSNKPGEWPVREYFSPPPYRD